MRQLLAGFAVMAAFACGGATSTNPEADISGTYAMRTYDGSPLPYALPGSTTNYTLTSDILTLVSDKSWRESESYRRTINGQTSNGNRNYGGSWTRAGSFLTLRNAAGDSTVYMGTYTTNTLTLNALSLNGIVQVFVK